MQAARESFYLALRDRLVALNVARTAVIRSALRPAIAVEENELDGSLPQLPETFVLRWGALSVDANGLMCAACSVSYWTEGSVAFAGLDRGRVLGAMDEELRRMLLPCSAAVVDVQTGDVSGVRVFWSAPEFGAAEMKDGRLMRRVTVDVFAPSEVSA